MNDQSLTQLPLDLPKLSVIDGHATTTSLQVAEDFGKRHDDVLKAISRLECSEEFRLRNFAETPYIHPQNGNTYKMYNLTRDGFTFLAMGFTGSKAAAWKEKYIRAFNLMETRLREQEGRALSPRQQPQLPAPTLSPAHQRELQKKISEKVYAVSGNRRQRDQLFPQIQRDFKDHFRIQSYKDLPDDQFDLALGWVDGYVFEGDPPRLALPGRVVFSYPIDCQYDPEELRAFRVSGAPSIVVQTIERLLAKQKTSPLRRLLAQITTERLGDVEGCMEELDNIYYQLRLIYGEQHNLRMLMIELGKSARTIDYAVNSVERLRSDGRAILIQTQSQKEVV